MLRLRVKHGRIGAPSRRDEQLPAALRAGSLDKRSDDSPALAA